MAQEVAAALAQSLAPDEGARTTATEQLMAWEIQPGFLTALLEIFGLSEEGQAYTEDTELRFLAVVKFKSCVSRFWRKSAENAVSEEEKASVRFQLMQLVAEQDDRIAMQVAAVLGEIGRLDVPRNWPELIPALSEGLKSENPIVAHRCLMYLYYTAKRLVSKRLRIMREMFAQIAVQVNPFIFSLLQTLFQQMLSAASDGVEDGFLPLLEHCRLCLKCVRQFVAFGHSELDEVGHNLLTFLIDNWPNVASLLAQFEGNPAEPNDNDVTQAMGKLTRMWFKTLRDVLNNHTFAVLPHLQASVGLVMEQLMSPPEVSAQYQEDIRMRCYLIIRNILMCSRYTGKQPETRQDDPTITALRDEAGQLMAEIFSSDNIRLFFNMMVEKDLSANTAHLGALMEDASFVPEEAGSAFIQDIWNTTASTYKELLARFPMEVGGLTHELVRSWLIHGTSTHAVAAMICLARGAFVLYDFVNFDELLPSLYQFSSSLAPDSVHDQYARAVLLDCLGCWIPIQYPLEQRDFLYQILQDATSSQSVLYVRMAAIECTRKALNDTDFSLEQFKPYSVGIFSNVAEALAESDCPDLMVRLMDAMEALVGFLEEEAIRFIPILNQVLPQMWESANETGHNLLQAKIITLLARVIDVTNTSQGLEAVALPVLSLGLDTESPASVYLLDTSVRLWHSVLQTSQGLQAELVGLFDFLPPLLDRGDSILDSGMAVLMSYVLLASDSLLVPPSISAVVQSIIKLLDAVPRTGLRRFLDLVDTTLLLTSVEHSLELLPMLQAFLQALLKIEDNDSAYITGYLVVLARVLVSHPALFDALAASCADTLNLYEFFITTVPQQYDRTTRPLSKKLACMALLRATELPSCQQHVAEHIGEVVDVFINGIHQFHTRRGEQVEVDILVLEADDDESWKHDPHAFPEAIRKKTVALQDPVQTKSLQQTVSATFAVLLQDSTFTELLGQLDDALQEQLQAVLS
eukprot:m.28314 g.28314  ORF g.28314 m.28314 type:complete len:975 (+) comp9036_c0_seq2:113-3037(+)